MAKRVCRASLAIPALAGILAGQSDASGLPLSIADLTVPAHRLTVSTQFDYLLSRQDVAVGSDTQALLTRRAETGALSTRARWGLSPALEVNTTLTTQHLQQSAWPVTEAHSERQAWSVGGAWLVADDRAGPALQVSLDLELLGDSFYPAADPQFARGLTIGATTWYAIDPVVFSLSASYHYQRTLESAGTRIEPGGVLSLQPQVNFAVNHRVSLVGGLACRVYQATRAGGRVRSPRDTDVAVLLGVGTQWGPRSTLFANTEFSTAGADRARLSLEWVLRF